MKKESIIRLFRGHPNRSYSFEDLVRTFKIPSGNHRQFRTLMRKLLGDGEVSMHKHKYCLFRAEDRVEGIVSKHRRGFAFVIPGDPTQEDVFLNQGEARALMDGDRVQVIAREGLRGKKEGVVFKILERGQKRVVGTLKKFERHYFVIPYGVSEYEASASKMYVSPNNIGGAKEGEVVVADIVGYPDGKRSAEGKVATILGVDGDPKIDTDIIISKYDLPTIFPKGVREESSRVPTEIAESEFHNRRDLRKLPFVTIDGESAKDFDDAICVMEENNAYRLWVSIADVSYYVKAGSALDREALTRGNSIYFPDRVIPMLPEVLSNEICSLKPNVDRLTFTAEMTFDKNGKRLTSEVYESVIRSWHRLTYTEVWKMMDGDQKVIDKYKKYYDNLRPAVALFRLLKNGKSLRGSLDFDLPESQIILDATGRIEQIVKSPRNDAHMLIEEFMIAANEAVAEFIEASKTPGIYRVHEPPDNETINVFRGLLHNLGFPLQLGEGRVKPIQLASIIKKVEGKPEARLINTVLLRSLKQAMYSRENVGHFGLASAAYTHFTSPIRRYPDLLAHRLLKNLKKTSQLSDKKIGELQSTVDSTAQQSNKRERLAMEAEREVVEVKKCLFMQDKVGEEYYGFIEGIAEFGLFVELEDWFVEGLIKFANLEDDEYSFFEDEYLARGRRTKRVFKLGDRIKIRVDAVRLSQREIDFSLIEVDG